MKAAAAVLVAKPWVTLQARATLAGYRAELVELDDGRTALIVTRDAVTRCLQSIERAEAWLEQTAHG